MARELSDKDMNILYALAPEIKERKSIPYRSILPPISKFYSQSPQEFKKRVETLHIEDLEYLIELIFEGKECLRCLELNYVNMLIEVVDEKISDTRASDLKELYNMLNEE